MALAAEGEWQEGPWTRGSARCAITYTTVNVAGNWVRIWCFLGFGKMTEMCSIFLVKVLMHCIEMNTIQSLSFFI